MYGAIDLLVVGQFGDASGVSAVATGSQIMQTLTGVGIVICILYLKTARWNKVAANSEADGAGAS